MSRAVPLALVCAFAAAVLAPAQTQPRLLDHFAWRSVGPAGAGGRIVSIAAAGAPQRLYVAAATGGLWRSDNEGTSWQPLFDRESLASIGAVAVDASNSDTVWVGTGEANPRNSVSWGDGVYRSKDGGRTWTHLGLTDTRHIARIVIDRRNSDTVYVAALGHLWGPNRERGVFKTTDGGATWTPSLFINDDTGVVDLVADPHDATTLYAAAYEVRRDGFAGGDPEKGWGPGSGIYKTTDAGRTWRKLTEGLPAGALGRIGIDVSASDPSVVYAVVQTPTTVPRETADEAGPPAPSGPRTPKDGGIFRSDDRGETWQWVNSLDVRPFYYSQIRVDPANERHIYVLGSSNSESDDGGRTFRTLNANVHVDHHALWIDPGNSRHMVDGNDGGIYMTWDGGRTWDFQSQMALSQMYSVDVDMRKPYYIYGGSQDYCSWGGPSATPKSVGIRLDDWFRVQTGDGFQARVDPTDYTIVYAESQNGGLVRHDLKSGRNVAIKPRAREGAPAYRFNWETPIQISAHDPKTIYVGGNRLFKSTNRGDEWDPISPDLTTEKVGTITTLSESPIDAAVLYAGTDDGHLWATRNGGQSWKEITSRVPGMPGRRWVSRVVASRYEPGTVYVAFDGHPSDDVTTYLFRSTDFGETWKSIRSDLPPSTPVRVIREDVKNAHLLFAGTEAAAWTSWDDGAHWHRLMNNMPTVPVADLIVHPRDGELVAATHGRSFFVMDISPLQELTPAVLDNDVHLFAVKPAMAADYRAFSDDQFLADKRFIGQNPPEGTTISYFLKTEPAGAVALAIVDKGGAVVRELTATHEAGINRVQWDLRGKPLVTRAGEGGRTGQAGRAGQAEQPGQQGPAGPLVDPGDYTVRLTVNGREFSTPVAVEGNPLVPLTTEQRAGRRSVVSALVGLQAKTEPASARAASISTQLVALLRTVSAANAPAAVKDSVSTAAKSAADLEKDLARINRNVIQLYGQVNGSPFVPTVTERDELTDLDKEYTARAGALDTLVQTTLPALDRQLTDAGISRISVK